VTGERVVVVGAGPAGIRAAEVLSAPGVAVTLVDDRPAPGGRHYPQPPVGTATDYRALYGLAAGRARRLHATASALAARVDYRAETKALGVEGKLLHVSTVGVGETLPFEALILAPGADDLLLPFPGATRPGVVTLGAAQAALRRGQGAAGRRTVFLGSGPRLYDVAYQYLRAGAEVAAVLETADPALARRQLPGLLSGGLAFARQLFVLSRLKAAKVPMLAGVRPVAVVGGDTIEGLRCRDGEGTEFQVTGDALAVGFGPAPDTRLAAQVGCVMLYDLPSRQWLPSIDADGLTSVPGIYVAGDGRQEVGADAAEASGALAAFAVLIELGYPVTVGMHRFWQTRAGYGSAYRRALRAAFPPPVDLAVASADDTVVCGCQGITAGALRRVGMERGAAGAGEAKSGCGIGAGPCRGLYCVVAADEILAEALGLAPEAVGHAAPVALPP